MTVNTKHNGREGECCLLTKSTCKSLYIRFMNFFFNKNLYFLFGHQHFHLLYLFIYFAHDNRLVTVTIV